MATAEKIYIDRTNKRLLKHSDGQFQPTSAQDLLLASHNGQIPIEVYGIERTEASGYGAYSAEGYTSASYATDDLRVVIGPCGECQLVSGTFKLTHSATDTDAIDVDNLSADVIERALNSLASIRTAGSVQVSQVRGALKYVIEGITNGALGAVTASELSIVPDSSISIVEVDAGTATTKARYVMTVRPEPFAQLTTWAAVSAASIAISELTVGSSTQYETQRVTITGPIYGGYFTLTDGSNVTAPIPVTATASTVEDQVNAVLGTSTVTVSKPRAGTWDIRWATTGDKTILTVAGAVESYSGVSGTLELNTVNLSAAIEGLGTLPGKFQIVETISGTEQRLIYEEVIQLHEEIVSSGSITTITPWHSPPAVITIPYNASAGSSGIPDPITADVNTWLTSNSQSDGTLLRFPKPLPGGASRFPTHGTTGTTHDPDANGPIYAWTVYNDTATPIGLIPGTDPDWQFTNWSATEIKLGRPGLNADWSAIITAAVESLLYHDQAKSGGGTFASYSGTLIFADPTGNLNNQATYTSGEDESYVITDYIPLYKFLVIRGETEGTRSTIMADASNWTGTAAPDGLEYMIQPPFLEDAGGSVWSVVVKDLALYCTSTQGSTAGVTNGIYWVGSISSSIKRVKIRSPLTNGVTISAISDTTLFEQIIVEGRTAVHRVPVGYNFINGVETCTMLNCEAQFCDVGIKADRVQNLRILNFESESVGTTYDLITCENVTIDGNIQTVRNARGPQSATALYAHKTVTGITTASPGVITTSAAHNLSVGDGVYFPTGTFTFTDAVAGATVVDQYTGLYVSSVPSTTTIEVCSVPGEASVAVTSVGSGITMGRHYNAIARVTLPTDGGTPLAYNRRHVHIKGSRDLDGSSSMTRKGVLVCRTSTGAEAGIDREQFKEFVNSGRSFDFQLYNVPQHNLPTFGVDNAEVAGDGRILRTYSFLDAAARAAYVPTAIGDLAVQRDDGTLWRAYGTSAGNWRSTLLTPSLTKGAAGPTRWILNIPPLTTQPRIDLQIDTQAWGLNLTEIYKIGGGYVGQTIELSILYSSSGYTATFKDTGGGSRLKIGGTITLDSEYDVLTLKKVMRNSLTYWVAVSFQSNA